VALNIMAGTMWHIPGAFNLVRGLGSHYSLRCVLFHDVCDHETAFTKGLGGTITCENFERALSFLSRYYTPVSLQDVIGSFDGQRLPERPVLVTFDDAYASVAEVAAPLCTKFGVPAAFFVNAACLDNKHLALDNLVCYVANVFGLDTINAAIHAVGRSENGEVSSLKEVFSTFLPGISLSSRKMFRKSLISLAGVDDAKLAVEAGLYVSSAQLRKLAASNFEIGNHTLTHVHCRTLQTGEFDEEIDNNRSILEKASGKRIRSFSVPYGSSTDVTPELLGHFRRRGYDAIFLAEGRANNLPADGRVCFDRVSVHADREAGLFSEIEVLPRLRSIRDGMRQNARTDYLPHDAGLRNASSALRQ
jgi:peptidoglycan/xylan/chitin deacetylase (PgdA/CDA1 family)